LRPKSCSRQRSLRRASRRFCAQHVSGLEWRRIAAAIGTWTRVVFGMDSVRRARLELIAWMVIQFRIGQQGFADSPTVPIESQRPSAIVQNIKGNLRREISRIEAQLRREAMTLAIGAGGSSFFVATPCAAPAAKLRPSMPTTSFRSASAAHGRSAMVKVCAPRATTQKLHTKLMPRGAKVTRDMGSKNLRLSASKPGAHPQTPKGS